MRRTHVVKALVVVAAAVLVVAAPAAAAPHTATCVATATLDPPTNYSSSGGGGITIVRFDFTGVHDLCLGDGTIIVATMVGHLTQVTRNDGTGNVVVRETLSVPGGTLDAMIQARFSPTSFDASVLAFHGTGTLAGITGRGTTTPTGPNTFLSQIVYRYP